MTASGTRTKEAVAASILLVDDDESLRRVTGYHLEEAGFEVRTAPSAEEALVAIEKDVPDLLVTDVRMPGIDGIELLRRTRSRWPELGVVVVTAHGSVESAVEAMRLGAHDYLQKPFSHEELRLTIEKALRIDELVRENRRLREMTDRTLRFEGLVATSAPMGRLLKEAQRMAVSDSTVLLLGESGTGKELLARAIVHASRRRDQPLVTVNAGSLPPTLIDSELFGHAKGAFTGASQSRRGRFEQADGGTLFLDEIGDLQLDLQGKLLRAIQEGEIQRLGEERTRRVDVRLIAATNRDLEAMVADGSFREDLYYRLAVLPLTLPPLRERRDDIPPLVAHFLSRSSRRGAKDPGFTEDALERLHSYDWPGNVRELENVVERAVVLEPEGPRGPQTLPPRVADSSGASESWLGELPESGIDLEEVERELIRRALDKCGGNQSATARFLGVSRNTLLYRLEKHGLR